MHVLIAPNAFKNALSAEDAAIAINQGLKKSAHECTTELFPVGDGGDGTARLISNKLNGIQVQKMVQDPLGRKINACFYFLKESNSAIIELAEASGLKLLKKEEYNPLITTTFGTGELIRYALDLGVQQIMLCIGGSGTVDGGAGLLHALGICFRDKYEIELKYLPKEFDKLHRIDISGIDKRILNCKLIILCDVDNVLTGPEGAASVFGPQKGATPEDVQLLERSLSHFAAIIKKQFGIDIEKIKHGGAAGGTAAGAYALLNANLEDGIESFLSITGFDEALKKADLVITGEGSVDTQTLHGKGPAGIARRAQKIGVPVIAFGGKVQHDPDGLLSQLFDQLISISANEQNLETALTNTAKNLEKAAKELGNSLARQ